MRHLQSDVGLIIWYGTTSNTKNCIWHLQIQTSIHWHPSLQSFSNPCWFTHQLSAAGKRRNADGQLKIALGNLKLWTLGLCEAVDPSVPPNPGCIQTNLCAELAAKAPQNALVSLSFQSRPPPHPPPHTLNGFIWTLQHCIYFFRAPGPKPAVCDTCGSVLISIRRNISEFVTLWVNHKVPALSKLDWTCLKQDVQVFCQLLDSLNCLKWHAWPEGKYWPTVSHKTCCQNSKSSTGHWESFHCIWNVQKSLKRGRTAWRPDRLDNTNTQSKSSIMLASIYHVNGSRKCTIIRAETINRT